MGEIAVRKVESKQDFKVFFEFPWTVYKDNPYWVPNLKSMRRHLLDRDHAAAWEYMDGEFFVAWDGSQPVGTIAAFVNHRHNETWNENVGWFGVLDFLDDLAIPKALFAAAESYLHDKGVEALRGPVNVNLQGEIGVLLNAYDRTPQVLMPYNHPYYPTHIEAAGYEKCKDLVTWYHDDEGLTKEGGLPSKLYRVVEKNNKRRNITIRTGNRKTLEEDFRLIYELYNAAWADNWSFVPLTERELEELIADLKQFYVPEITCFGFVDGEPAGFILAVPDMNEPIRLAYPRPGEPEIWTLLKIFWHWKIRPKITTARVVFMGVVPKFRGLGVEASLLLYDFEQALLSPYVAYEGGWVLEDNDKTNTLLQSMHATPDRRYRIYEKSFKA
jgi:GNAT superfamily N-acetyltransferase